MNPKMPKWLIILWTVGLIGLVTYVALNWNVSPTP